MSSKPMLLNAEVGEDSCGFQIHKYSASKLVSHRGPQLAIVIVKRRIARGLRRDKMQPVTKLRIQSFQTDEDYMRGQMRIIATCRAVSEDAPERVVDFLFNKDEGVRET